MVLALNMTWGHCDVCWDLDFEPSETSSFGVWSPVFGIRLIIFAFVDFRMFNEICSMILLTIFVFGFICIFVFLLYAACVPRRSRAEPFSQRSR